jgi:hypothetical protein
MPRIARHILAALLVGLYGGATLLGPALHSAGGLGHAPAHPDARDGSDSRAVLIADTHHDCPICHFLAQGQVLDSPDAQGMIDVVHVRPTDELPLVLPSGLPLPAHPRAPPLAS